MLKTEVPNGSFWAASCQDMINPSRAMLVLDEQQCYLPVSNVVHKHRWAERWYWCLWSTDTFLCSLCFYSVLSLILLLMLDRQEKKGLFEIVHKRPKSLIYQFMLVSLRFLLRHLHAFPNVLWGFFSLSVSVGFVEWEMFSHSLVGLGHPSKDVSFDQWVAPGSWKLMTSHWHHLITLLAVFPMRSFNKIVSVRVKSIILIFGSGKVISWTDGKSLFYLYNVLNLLEKFFNLLVR